jgi:rhamnose utilization protein RhaD (predicted bifunctional aldolase and dehydrogenase)/NAD(P)-dependent dehydrogenase (short-subunit alcohol dehydrogenase family)
MLSLWSEPEAERFRDRYSPKWGDDLALRTYSARLLGAEPGLVLHGGGNTSVKTARANIFGEHLPALYIKASGLDLASIEPEGHSGLDLEYLLKLRSLESLSDGDMVNQLRTHLLDSDAATPSIETLVHAFIPEKFIDHTHADAILGLTNQEDGRARIQEALGPDILVLDYVAPGFGLAKAVGSGYDSHPRIRGMVWMRHGLITWGATARQSYETTIELVSRAERYLAARQGRRITVQNHTPLATAQERWVRVAPVLRGLLAQPSRDPDQAYSRVILQPLVTDETLEFVDSECGKQVALTPPLTTDHLIRTKALPLWIDNPEYQDPQKLHEQMVQALGEYCSGYEAYIRRNMDEMPEGVFPFSPMPRVILMPGLGAVCAGRDAKEAKITRDITAHTLAVKAQAAAMGVYAGLPEPELFHMEYRTLQHAKLKGGADLPLSSHVALVTGAAGAIGSAIAEELLGQGCHVAVTDLPGEPLDRFTRELKAVAPDNVTGVPMDVTGPESVRLGFDAVAGRWGGVDLVIVNAGIALAASLAEVSLEAFRKLERVNVEGSLLVLAEAARHLRLQGTGGDIVLVSTKNVFSPGPRFGAYSATKAAAHQLARIASLELAELGVRVNMVAPDAVFSHGARRSGLWAEVGPDRMRARGLQEDQLEEYYQKRNLLKVKVTARHVARAVLFFATRQTPTTGASLPVDGGLPEATPR